jgi:FixJ family two-component response regulator
MSSANHPAMFIVEDDAAMRDALHLLIQNAGFEVSSYATAEELLASAEFSRPFAC